MLPQICPVWCTKLRKHFNAVMEVFHCFTIRSASLAMHQTTMKTKGRQLQPCSAHAKQSCRVRAGSEILVIWAALKQLLENKNEAMCVASLRLIKTKKMQHGASFCQHWHHTWQNWAVFLRGGCFDFPQVKSSVELCISKLSDAAAKSEFKANCEKFDSELEELGTLDVLADSCVSSVMACWKGTEWLANWSSPHTKREAGVNEPTTAASFC